jgi:protein farnesyltransferase subunit beta
MELLEIPIDADIAARVVNFLSKCELPDGGYGGGPSQLAHLAPTYAAISALCIIGTNHAYESINRKTLASYLMRMRCPDGSFRMHESGEVDIRGAYCAAVIARLTGIATNDMFDGTPEWIVRCQTYEGGFAGGPGLEAHGGYSFCGLATLVLLGKHHLCDLRALLRWTAARQMSFEGGFQGRTNKLVDGCYSFWQGGAFPIIHSLLAREGDKALSTDAWLFHQDALQEYVLICCQHSGGGLIDKPGKARDFYHTCYCLSGLSVAQHFAEGKLSSTRVIGDKKNQLFPIHPLFNIGIEAVRSAHLYFDSVTHQSDDLLADGCNCEPAASDIDASDTDNDIVCENSVNSLDCQSPAQS